MGSEMCIRDRGCLPHVVTSSAMLQRCFRIVPRRRVFAFRWEDWGGGGGPEWDFLHFCCCSYDVRVRELSRCIEPLNSGADCTNPERRESTTPADEPPSVGISAVIVLASLIAVAAAWWVLRNR